MKNMNPFTQTPYCFRSFICVNLFSIISPEVINLYWSPSKPIESAFADTISCVYWGTLFVCVLITVVLMGVVASIWQYDSDYYCLLSLVSRHLWTCSSTPESVIIISRWYFRCRTIGHCYIRARNRCFVAVNLCVQASRIWQASLRMAER